MKVRPIVLYIGILDKIKKDYKIVLTLSSEHGIIIKSPIGGPSESVGLKVATDL